MSKHEPDCPYNYGHNCSCMTSTQPTGLDLDDLLMGLRTAKTGVSMESDETLVARAKQALTRWGLEQRIDELEAFKFNAVFKLHGHYQLDEDGIPEIDAVESAKLYGYISQRQAELQANLQDGGEA